MKRALVVLSVLAVCFLGFNGFAHAGVIGFDNLATPNSGSGVSSWGYVPSSYQGLTWTDWEVTENATYNSVYGNSVTFPSGPNAAYNGGNSDPTVEISSTTPFNFTSAYFFTWAYNNAGWQYGSTSLTITGYLNGTQKDSIVIPLAVTPTLETLNFSDVNDIKITTVGGTNWLMDNAQVSAVPVPASLLLLAPGLLGLVGMRKRFIKA